GSKGAHDPCVEWSVTTVNRRAEGTTRPRKTHKNLERETVIVVPVKNRNGELLGVLEIVEDLTDVVKKPEEIKKKIMVL
ncbi:MAG: histidine kinase, partial [Desulfurococcaceae archaeon]